MTAAVTSGKQGWWFDAVRKEGRKELQRERVGPSHETSSERVSLAIIAFDRKAK